MFYLLTLCINKDYIGWGDNFDKFHMNVELWCLTPLSTIF